jgi:hypothetical protein
MRKNCNIISAVLGTVLITGIFAGSSIRTEAKAAYDTVFTDTYTFETLLKPALTNPHTSDRGIYRQLELAFRYRVMTQGEVMDLYDLGYTVPKAVLKKLYEEGYIGGYVYHRAAGLPITAADMSAVFDAAYYADANPDLKAAFGYDEAALLNHFLTCGMNEGRRAGAGFDPVYFKNNNADIRKELGDNWYWYYIHYILHGVEQGRAGSSEDAAKKVDQLSRAAGMRK